MRPVNSLAIPLSMLLAVLMTASWPVQASMRCDGGIVSSGMTIEEVLERCGEPDEYSIDRPNLHEDGFMFQGAAQVERWQYGPDRGMYRSLRFIDGRLVEIRSRRY